jgi:hypothetical protein
MRLLLALFRNPLFRHEVRCPVRWRWTLALALGSTAYVVAFVVAHARWERALPSGAAAYAPQFNYVPWLLGGAVILSLCSHWLVPPFVLTLTRARYELPSLTVLVREQVQEDESLYAQLAARVAPLLLGLAPLLALAGLLSMASLKYGLLVTAADGVGLLWAAFATTVSLWIGVTVRRPALAHACAYGLLSFVFPLLIAGLAATVGLGCSAGHARPAPVFWIASSLTWSILVVGFAATFWDLAFGQVFPERRYALWREAPPTQRLEP